jgi:hypothetical protein
VPERKFSLNIVRELFGNYFILQDGTETALHFLKIHLFTWTYIVWVISPPRPPPPPSPIPQFQAGPVLLLALILLKRRHKQKKDKAFLLVELRTAIQRDS